MSVRCMYIMWVVSPHCPRPFFSVDNIYWKHSITQRNKKTRRGMCPRVVVMVPIHLPYTTYIPYIYMYAHSSCSYLRWVQPPCGAADYERLRVSVFCIRSQFRTAVIIIIIIRYNEISAAVRIRFYCAKSFRFHYNPPPPRPTINRRKSKYRLDRSRTYSPEAGESGAHAPGPKPQTCR